MFHTKEPLLCLHTAFLEVEPSYYSKVAANPRWHTTMCSEFEALLSNAAWTLCPRPHTNLGVK
jgi:hypothetical protein